MTANDFNRLEVSRDKLTHRFVGSSGLAAALCHALQCHSGKGSGRLDVEAVIVFLEELLLVVSGIKGFDK